MRKVFLIITAVLCSYNICFSRVNFQQITIEKAMELARVKLNQKKILLYFTTSWCGRCKVLDKQVFHNNEMSEYINKRYVCLEIDGESKQGKKIQHDYGIIDLYPTTLILNKNGNEIDRIIGYSTQKEYFEKIVDYYKNENTLQALLESAKKDSNNGDIFFALNQKYEAHRNIKKQLFYMEKAIQFEPYKKSHHHWYFLSMLYGKNKNKIKAIKALKQACDIAPDNSHYTACLEKLNKN